MIKINVSPKKKEQGAVGGIDFSHLNVKMFLISLIVLYVPEIFLEDHYLDQISQVETQTQSKRTEQRKIKRKVKELDKIKKRVDALSEQEKKLELRLEAVKQVLGKKQNPFSLMKYVANSVPESIWFESMSVENNKLNILGKSKSWKDISELLQNLKSSIFLSDVEYTVPQSKDNEYFGEKIEVFNITANITRYR